MTTTVFIDSRVSDHETLISSFAPGTDAHVLDPTIDGVLQIRDLLAGQSGYDSIQVISTGSPGSISIGSTVLSSFNLPDYADELLQIGSSLAAGGGLLLYGSNVASGTEGQAFIKSLSEMTGAQVENNNYEPTGGVAITGTAMQGELLTADIHALADADGIGIISYQWKADGVDISGATGHVFLPGKAEIGSKISVSASYMDRLGTNESVSSAETGIVVKSSEGQVHDGYFSDALVWVDSTANGMLDWSDADNDGRWDTGEGECWVYTDQTGQFRGLAGEGTIRSVGGTDISTGRPFTGSFSAPSGSSVINPLTTLVVAALASGGSSSDLNAALGLPPDLDLTVYDPLAEASKATASGASLALALNVQGAAMQISNIMAVAVSVQGAEAGTADSSDTIAGILTGFVGTGGLNLADSFVVSAALMATAESIDYQVLSSIADAVALVNGRIATVAAAAPQDKEDFTARLTEMVKAQIVAQERLATEASEAVAGGDTSKITMTDSNQLAMALEAVTPGDIGSLFINHVPTGAVIITGTPSPGEVMTADAGSLADHEGLGAFSYVWKADGVEIAGATGNTCLLSLSEKGREITVVASYTDGAGHDESSASLPTAPVAFAPTSLSGVMVDLKKGSDSGSSDSDHLTNITTPTVTVDLSGRELAAGDRVQIIDSNHHNAVLGSCTVTDEDVANGLSSKDMTLSTPLTDDLHLLSARLIDASNTPGLAGRTASPVTIDTVALAPTVALTNDSGSSNSDNITNDGALGVSGIEPGGVIEFSADGAGGWSGTAPTPVEGANTVHVRQVDVAGNISDESVFTFMFDSTRPGSAPAVALKHDSGSSDSDKITNDGALSVSGIEPCSVVEYSADGAGGWSGTAPSPIEGANTVHVRQVDVAGNVSDESLFTFTYDTVAPTVSSFKPGAASTGVAVDSDMVLTFTGPIEKGDGIIAIHSESAGEAPAESHDTTASISGNQLTINPAADLVTGTRYAVTIGEGAVTDVAGNRYAGSTDYGFTTTHTQTAPGASVKEVAGSGKQYDPSGSGMAFTLPSKGGVSVISDDLSAVPGKTLEEQLREFVGNLALSATESQAFQDGITGYASTHGATPPITVRNLSFSATAAFTPDPDDPVVINGTGASREALVIDVRNLPPNAFLELNDVGFALVVGPVHIRGGAGSNMVYADDSAQDIVLGAADDTLHGGGGNDYIGSLDGNDLLFGDAGNDTLSGGAGNDTIDGGAGTDTVVYTGNFAEYTVSYNATTSSYTVMDKVADRDGTDTLTHTEYLQFIDVTKTVADSVTVAAVGTAYADHDSGGLGTGTALIGGGAIGLLVWLVF